MSRRPEILFPLFASVKNLPKVGPKTAGILEKFGITRRRDVVFALPHNLLIREEVSTVQAVPSGRLVTVEVEVVEHRENRAKNRPYRVVVQDAQTRFQLVFFHPRKAWINEQLPIGQTRVISGKLEIFDGVAQIVHPDFIEMNVHKGRIPKNEPIYPLTAGISQKAMQAIARSAVDRLPDLTEWIAPSVIKDRGWPSWKAALETAHTPTTLAEVARTAPVRERLAYDELLAHQLTLSLARASLRKKPGRNTVGTQEMQTQILSSLPFKPTGAQTHALSEITADMASDKRMNRLLQGDVGAGKTLVALVAMAAAVEAGGQAVMMAPTEILVRQHYASMKGLCETAGIRLELLTGRDTGGGRQEKLAALENGQIDLLVGTHSVFQKDVTFKDLRLAVIDEQHRFGVRQRMDLGAKGQAVDVLVMTATPIPRSLSLAQYGDMDISVLDEKPAGRQPIDTVLVSSTRLDEVTERLKNAIAQGKQAYWVCPLVEESEVLDYTAAEDRAHSLRVALGEENVGLVHGQMPPADKDSGMAAFEAGQTKVLVSTTVIEVGVDVPKASIMVIERAEKFGLAQLHQLRGRVGRGEEKSTCLLMFGDNLTDTARKRLETMRDTNDGFEIAEVDLKLRGAGDVLGVAQSGLPKFQIADLEVQTDLMKTAYDDARMILNEDPNLTSERGKALRTLLYLMDHDQSIRLIAVG